MSEQSTTDKLDSLIFSNQKLEALRLLREQRGIDLEAAVQALSVRYGQLRAASPTRFGCDDAEYWQGFYS